MLDELIPTVVIAGYNRPNSLKRLLDSVERAEYGQADVTLVISLDHCLDKETLTIAQDFGWSHGSKKVIFHPEHLGLKNHFYFCAGLTVTYEQIILLEDDLIVSPCYYKYTKKALQFYRNEEKIAGFSLYAYHVIESRNNELPDSFIPVENGFDAYFMQVPSSWGVAWTKAQWMNFSLWKSGRVMDKCYAVPGYVDEWGSQSWKRIFYQYLIDADKYFVFPYRSLTTNFEDMGTHTRSSGLFQVPVTTSCKTYTFSQFGHSWVKYDAWFEPQPELINHFVPSLRDYDYEVDLIGRKTTQKRRWKLTSCKGQNPVLRWSDLMQPLVQNLIHDIQGTGIGLYHTEEVYRNHTNASEMGKGVVPISSAQLSIGLVIPVSLFQRTELDQTLLSLDTLNYRQLEVLLACSNNSFDEVTEYLKQFRASHDLRCEAKCIEAEGYASLGLRGLCHLRADARIWLRPGVTPGIELLLAINKILSTYTVPSILVGIGDSRHWPLFRLNNHLFWVRGRKKKRIPSSEGMIFRSHVIKSLLPDIEAAERTDELFHANFIQKLARNYWIFSNKH